MFFHEILSVAAVRLARRIRMKFARAFGILDGLWAPDINLNLTLRDEGLRMSTSSEFR